MEYIVIPTKDKIETNFFLSLLKKMKKKAATLTSEEMEDMAFTIAMKKAQISGRGNINNVMKHLNKTISGK